MPCLSTDVSVIEGVYVTEVWLICYPVVIPPAVDNISLNAIYRTERQKSNYILMWPHLDAWPLVTTFNLFNNSSHLGRTTNHKLSILSFGSLLMKGYVRMAENLKARDGNRLYKATIAFLLLFTPR
uniref:Uncharacterized protein n=2 Tax=Salmonella sp. TaxID=599 RepID=A0A482ET57_SALSP|nr:hypothetical protein NNIBIDOC_00034 [Salmonella sp.]